MLTKTFFGSPRSPSTSCLQHMSHPQSKLTFNYVRDAILMEHSHVKASQPVKQTMSKLSTVKQKGANPKWQPKQQLSEKKDDEESSEKKPHARGCHSGKEVKKHQAKQADDYK